LLVSVVIATYNEEHSIDKCVKSFVNQSFPKSEYEIIIADGGSKDKTLYIIKDIQREYTDVKIRIIENKKKIQAAAWNLGFKSSKATYVCMMGAHSFVDRDFIKNNVELLEKNPDIPCSGGIVKAIGESKKSKAIALTFNSKFGVGDAKYRYATENCLVETINYGMYRKSMIDQLKPIDETIVRGQDWEYNYRVVKKFGRMLFSPQIKVYYYSRGNFKKLWKKQFYAGYWKPSIVKKHPGSLLLRHFIPFLFSIILLINIVLLATENNIFYGIFLLVYILINFIFSILISLKEKRNYIFHLVTAFFLIHFAYGLGTIVGLHRVFSER
jgi:glycosyltransferase involved in cell wall biosynthesis